MNPQPLAPSPTADVDGARPEPAPSRRTGLVGRLVSVLMGLAMLFGIVLTAGPASAVGTTAPDISFCMKYSTGAAYANKPVYLYKNGVKVRSGSTNSAGCAVWPDVTGNAAYYVQAHWTYQYGWSMYAWTGYTNEYWVPNTNTTYGFGTGWAYHWQVY